MSSISESEKKFASLSIQSNNESIIYPFSIGYIGSKKTLINFVLGAIDKYNRNFSNFAELFAGTSIISYMVKNKFNTITTNDYMYYSFVLSAGMMQSFTEDEMKEIKSVIDKLNTLEGKKGFITTNYSPEGKRMYFTTKNAMKIDAVREEIQKYSDKKYYYYLLSSLLSAADKVANTASVYGAFLKKFKASAEKDIVLETYTLISSQAIINCHNKNVTETLNENYDIVYLDPPYNSRKYSSNYHILETIALGDNPAIHGVTGLRDNEKESEFCSKAKAYFAVSELIEKLNAKIILFSYNNDGIITFDELIGIFTRFGTVDVVVSNYKEFNSHNSNEAAEILEYIFVIDKEKIIKTNTELIDKLKIKK